MTKKLTEEELKNRIETNSRFLKYGCLPIAGLGLIILLFTIFWDGETNSDSNTINTSRTVTGEPLQPNREPLDESQLTQDQKEVLNSFKYLYAELIKIKDTDKFKKYGFMIGGPYNSWLKSVEKLKENEILIDQRIIIGDLQALGIAYVSSEGNETSVTKQLNEEFYRALNPIKVDSAVAPSGKNNYDKIKRDYQLIGRWIISNSIINASYKYEIYGKGNEYVGFFAQDDWNYEAEVLERKGSYFIIKGNNPNSRSGEYYQIDTEMNMVLFDQDGELTGYGYTATKDF